MSSSKKGFVLRLRDRSVLVLHEQCPQYSDILAVARTTFPSLRRTAPEDIVFLGSGPDCPWFGDVEIPEWTWKSFCSQLAYVTVAFKQEREQLEREQHEKVEPDSG
ncbi:hypothetical protein BGY98DRAFT_1177690 [Russula aff. rugulosa BPL654]|nr:hypothetical protein BGY98DRAFT_1177690 [Russula aff. rugulosa BPL654]